MFGEAAFRHDGKGHGTFLEGENAWRLDCWSRGGSPLRNTVCRKASRWGAPPIEVIRWTMGTAIFEETAMVPGSHRNLPDLCFDRALGGGGDFRAIRVFRTPELRLLEDAVQTREHLDLENREMVDKTCVLSSHYDWSVPVRLLRQKADYNPHSAHAAFPPTGYGQRQ